MLPALNSQDAAQNETHKEDKHWVWQKIESTWKWVKEKRQELESGLIRCLPLLLMLPPLLALALQSENQEAQWLWKTPDLETAGELTVLLGPLVAAAIAIERLIEAAFDWFERSLRRVADVVKVSVDTLNSIEKKYIDTYQQVAKIVEASSAGNIAAYDEAEEHLTRVEEFLRKLTEHPQYVSWKRFISIGAGFSIGLTAAIWGDLTMLNRIDIPIPRILDMFITGLVIGAGPGPTHSVIGLLQSSKAILDKLTTATSSEAGTFGKGQSKRRSRPATREA